MTFALRTQEEDNKFVLYLNLGVFGFVVLGVVVALCVKCAYLEMKTNGRKKKREKSEIQ